MAASWEATITPAGIARRERVAVAEAIVSAAMMSAVVAHSFDALGINARDGERRGQRGRARWCCIKNQGARSGAQ